MSNILTEGSDLSIGLVDNVEFKFNQATPDFIPTGATTEIGSNTHPFDDGTFSQQVTCNQIDCLGSQVLNIGITSDTTEINMAEPGKDTIVRGNLVWGKEGNAFHVGVKAPALGVSTLYSLPPEDIKNPLKTNGTANLSFDIETPFAILYKNSIQNGIGTFSPTKLRNWTLSDSFGVTVVANNINIQEEGTYLAGFSITWEDYDETGGLGNDIFRSGWITKNSNINERFGYHSTSVNDDNQDANIPSNPVPTGGRAYKQNGTALIKCLNGDNIQVYVEHNTHKTGPAQLDVPRSTDPIDQCEFWCVRIA